MREAPFVLFQQFFLHNFNIQHLFIFFTFYIFHVLFIPTYNCSPCNSHNIPFRLHHSCFLPFYLPSFLHHSFHYNLVWHCTVLEDKLHVCITWSCNVILCNIQAPKLHKYHNTRTLFGYRYLCFTPVTTKSNWVAMTLHTDL